MRDQKREEKKKKKIQRLIIYLLTSPDPAGCHQLINCQGRGPPDRGTNRHGGSA